MIPNIIKKNLLILGLFLFGIYISRIVGYGDDLDTASLIQVLMSYF
jgi:hypothetical protein